MKNKRGKIDDVMGGYKYLRAHQIRARMEAFKKRYCKACLDKGTCDYVRLSGCKGKKPRIS